MNGSHFALQDELVVGIDDDRLEIRIGRYQAQIAFVASGEVYLLHRQSSVDEGHHNIAVRDLFRTVNQTDIFVKGEKSLPQIG